MINEKSTINAASCDLDHEISHWECLKFFCGIKNPTVDQAFNRAKLNALGTTSFYKVFWPEVKNKNK
jgi:hypothetical protein